MRELPRGRALTRGRFARLTLAAIGILLTGGMEAICIAIGRWWLLPLFIVAPTIGVIVIGTLCAWASED